MTEISKKLQQETGKSEKTKRLNQIYDSLEMVVIYIEVNNSDEAYDIFETMNARGADLTVADLVKNYLSKKLGHPLLAKISQRMRGEKSLTT